MSQLISINIILYIENQEKSKTFYSNLLRTKPILDVEGMTEFQLTDHLKLGLMPNQGIAKILQDKISHPNLANGIPRCELYLTVNDLEVEYNNAIECGAKLISEIKDRDWGDTVCYFADPDGHVIAFAKANNQ